MNAADVQARALAFELRETQAKLDKVLAVVTAMQTERKHDADITNAMRRELAELRIKPDSAAPNLPTRLIQYFTEREPVAILDKAVQGPRVFLNNRESADGRLHHVRISRDKNGNLRELLCSYDLAARFMRMPQPNRRLHWKGNRAAYSAMLTLCQQKGFVERVGHKWRWVERFDISARIEWLAQFRPPHRVR